MATPTLRHEHLWTLADGTPVHAPPGRLTVGADGKLACHLCGQWFDHLGLHLRRHGWTARQYRDAVGLARRRSLCNASLSATIAGRQRRRWQQDPRLQHHFRTGQDAARSGDLAALARLVRREQVANDSLPLEVRRQRPEDLRRGRATQAARRAHHVAAVVAANGHATLADHLRAEYAGGASLATLAAATGLGRAALTAELDAAGVTRRGSGVNTRAGRASRARRNEERAAAAVGVATAELGAWLAEQTARGVTLGSLAHRVGHSVPWIRARIAS